MLKWLLLIFFCTHKPVPCLTTTRETSSYSRWKQILRSTIRHYSEINSLGHPDVTVISPSNTPSIFSETSGREYKNQSKCKTPGEQENRPSKWAGQSSYELTGTEAASTRPTRVKTYSFLYILWLSGYFYTLA